ncbi:hypothetical protein ACRBEV_32980 (plasmid) [Methylobacterium phyllosphaerae]
MIRKVSAGTMVMDQRQETARDAPHRAPEGEGLSEMRAERLTVGLGGLVVAFVSVIVLRGIGYQDAVLAVLLAAIVAGGAVFAFGPKRQ